MKYLKLLLIAFVLAGLFQIVPFFDSNNQLMAVTGNTTVTINADTDYDYVLGMSTYTSWSFEALADSAEYATSAGSETGWTMQNDGTCTIRKSTLAWNVSSIPTNAEIKSVTVRLYVQAGAWVGRPADWLNSYLGLYKMIDYSTSITVDDWSESRKDGNVMLFGNNYKTMQWWNTHDLTWVDFPMWDPYVSLFRNYLCYNNYFFVTWSTMRAQLNGKPSTPGSGMSIDAMYANADSATFKPQLVVTYSTPPLTRETSHRLTNDTDNPTPTGFEIADNITWLTPRCLYSGETAGICVNGESGANITLSAMTESGELISSINNRVKQNGKYYWYFTVGSDIGDFIRVYEQNNNLHSTWGRVQPERSSSMQNLYTYAFNTVYPQWDYPFDTYRIKENKTGVISWLTNTDNSDIPNYGFMLLVRDQYPAGDIFEYSFASLNTIYYTFDDSYYDYWAGESFILFSPLINQEGFNNYDGLIVNMQMPCTNDYSGYWTPVIYKLSDHSTLASCHSAYYYLYSSDAGISISIPSNMAVDISSGSKTGIPSRLYNLDLEIIDSNDNIVQSTQGLQVLEGQTTHYEFQPLTTVGNYQLRSTFYQNTLSPDYRYIYDSAFVVSSSGSATTTGPVTGPGTPRDWLGWLNDLLRRYGLNNEKGHWLVIFIICVALFIAGISTKNHSAYIACLVLIALTIAGAMIAGWINAWFIILACIIIGVLLYGLFRKKTQGRDSES